MIKENLELVRQNIAKAAEKTGRKASDITLVCVTKEATIDQVKEVIACGITDIGENRLQDAIEKYNLLRKLVKWHFIGHLQTNKVKKAVEIFNLIHSVDSFHLAEAISKEASKIDKTQDILIQINTSGEETKFGIKLEGIKLEETKDLIINILKLPNVNILGLMTIAPLVDDSERTRPCFRRLKWLSEEINNFLRITQLSMGMSQDYQVAIEEGATMVRIGSAIFK